MKLILYFNETALNYAIRKGNIDIVHLLLARPEINVNIQSISNLNINIISNNFYKI